MRACTLRSQLVAKVRASPNNGFPHEEQIGGTIYLSGTLANVCILTRKPPQIFNLRAHRHALLDQPGVCIYTYIQGSVTESAWDAPISMRKRKKESTLAEVEVAFNYGRRPPLASIRVPREFFNPQQIRVTRSTDGQRAMCMRASVCNVRVARLNRYVSTARPIEIVDRDGDRLVVFLFRFIDVSLSKLANSASSSLLATWKSFSALFFHHWNLIWARFLAERNNEKGTTASRRIEWFHIYS